ncbi:MAG: signal peptidase I [Acholeplasmatales bacterium]|nr:signal peptidase I [Acholeplasmatales bacterium]
MEEKKKIKKSNIVLYVITSILITLCLYIGISVFVGNVNNRPPRVFGLSFSYVPTKSMEPEIMAGDYVIFSNISFDAVQTGDVVVYYNQGEDKYIIHRVVGKTADYLVCKGDNNPSVDNVKVTKDILFGKYIGKADFLKIFSGGVNRLAVYIVIVVLIILFFVLQIISYIVKSKQEELKEAREEEKNLLREEMRNEILKEELEKLKDKDK